MACRRAEIVVIKAITFDLDDTLWPIAPTIARAEQALHEWLSQHAPATARAHTTESLRELRNELLTTRPDLAHDVALVRKSSIALALAQAGDDERLVEAAWEVFASERQRVDPYEDVLPALEALAARYPLAVITNGNADIERIGIGHFFKVAIAAGSTGFAKPDPRIFLLACERLGFPPEEVLHVGDDAHLDAIASRRAGLRSAWVNRAGRAWVEGEEAPHHTLAHLGELVTHLLASAVAADGDR